MRQVPAFQARRVLDRFRTRRGPSALRTPGAGGSGFPCSHPDLNPVDLTSIDAARPDAGRRLRGAARDCEAL